MPEPDSHDALRSRLATESILAQKQRELAQANTRIAERAKVLTEEVIERRTEAEEARTIAERERSRHLEAASNLRRAKSETIIAERRLWTSLETMADGFAVFDRDTRVVAANPAFFLPYEDIDCVKLGVSYGELVDIAIEEGLIDPGEMTSREWSRWMKDRWNTPTIAPVTLRFWNNQFVRLSERRTPDGDVVMMGMNITRQIRRQKALEEARRHAEAANRAKSAFLANMSHEIRTPMNGVLAMADMMAEGDLDEEQRLCLDTIRSSGEALLVIINDVLDYSKIEAQKLSVENAPFDLEASINEVTTLLMPGAREKNLSLIVDYDMFLPTIFMGDKGRIRQILMNLVGNAVKFTEEGHVAVRVVGLPDPRPDHYRLHITVEDTGIGIEPEMREHIFGEFNQVQSEMTRQFDGTGLGLAITRRLVALMGGDMWVDTGAESGSVFGFRLTLAKEGPDIEGLRGRFGQRRVVLYDPEAQSREVMLKQMRALGLRPEALDEPEDPAVAELGADDLVMICDDNGLQGTVIIGTGPRYRDRGIAMPRPVLRDTLLDALTHVTAPPGPRTQPELNDVPPPLEAEPDVEQQGPGPDHEVVAEDVVAASAETPTVAAPEAAPADPEISAPPVPPAPEETPQEDVAVPDEPARDAPAPVAAPDTGPSDTEVLSLAGAEVPPTDPEPVLSAPEPAIETGPEPDPAAGLATPDPSIGDASLAPSLEADPDPVAPLAPETEAHVADAPAPDPVAQPPLTDEEPAPEAPAAAQPGEDATQETPPPAPGAVAQPPLADEEPAPEAPVAAHARRGCDARDPTSRAQTRWHSPRWRTKSRRQRLPLQRGPAKTRRKRPRPPRHPRKTPLLPRPPFFQVPEEPSRQRSRRPNPQRNRNPPRARSRSSHRAQNQSRNRNRNPPRARVPRSPKPWKQRSPKFSSQPQRRPDRKQRTRHPRPPGRPLPKRSAFWPRKTTRPISSCSPSS